MKLRSTVPFVAALLLAASALAQTAASSGVLAQAGTCLDLDGAFTESRPPPAGTRVLARPCDGRPSQRWTVLYGDYDHVLAVGGERLGWGRSNRGRAVVGDRAERLGWQPLPGAGGRRLAAGTIRTYDDRCLTLRGGELVLAACADEDLHQRWVLR